MIYEIKPTHLFLKQLETLSKKALTIIEEKIRLIKEICKINEKSILNSDRFFSDEAIRGRAIVNAIDYGKNRKMKYAEMFRGKIEL